MAIPKDYPPFDASKIPELLRLIKEVNESKVPREIKSGQDTLAILVPAPDDKISPKSREDRWQAFLSAAGSWSDVDTDALVRNIYADRELDDRPRIDL